MERVIENFVRPVYLTLVKTRVQDAQRESCMASTENLKPKTLKKNGSAVAKHATWHATTHKTATQE